MQPIGVRDVEGYAVMEDAGGILHMVYTKHDGSDGLYHRELGPDGAWSADQRIADKCEVFDALMGPDGNLAVMWKEIAPSEASPSHWAHVLHVAHDRDGRFEEGPSFEYAKDGVPLIIGSILRAFFDGRGEFQCLYMACDQDYNPLGYFLGNRQLTRREQKEGDLIEVPVAPGLSVWGGLLADSRGGLHVFGAAGEAGTATQSLVHCHSTDGGATWSGPHTILDNLPDFGAASQIGADGNIELIVNKEEYSLGAEPRVIFCTLNADTYELASSRSFLSSDESRDVTYSENGNPEFRSFYFCAFTSAHQAQDGTLRLLGEISDYYTAALKPDGAWDFRMLDAPGISLKGAFFRRDGDLFVLGSDMNREYFWGELGW